MPSSTFRESRTDFRTYDFPLSHLGFKASAIEHIRGEPVRRIANGRRHKVVGAYYSSKNGRLIEWESRAELSGFYHAEVMPNVVRYGAQPHKLKLVIDGRAQYYTPDREDTLANGLSVVTEIKDNFEALEDRQYAEKLEYADIVYRYWGKKFLIQERSDIEAQPIFDCVRTIQAFRRTTFTAFDLTAVQESFFARTVVPLAALADRLAPARSGLPKVCAMMVKRLVEIDITKPLGDESPVRLFKTGGTHLA